MSLLDLQHVTVARGGTRVVRNVCLQVSKGSITVLLGPNGAGKSSLLDAIAGVIPIEDGAILLDRRDIASKSARQRFLSGIAYVEQGRTVFPRLSVRKNIEAAAIDKEKAQEALKQVLDIFPELEKRLEVPAGMLSGGEQQMIVLGRTLITRPRVLLIDELSLGLAPVVVQRFLPLLTRLKQQGITILLVEQYAKAALSIGDGVVVLAHGEIVLEDHCEALRLDPTRLQRAYLG